MDTGRFSSDFPKDGQNYLFDIAMDDASLSIEEAIESGGARQRRQAVRSVFAFIDGCHNSVRSHVESQATAYGHLYSLAELAVLREESPYVDDRGNVKVRPLKVPLITSIKALVKLLSKNQDAPHSVDLNHPGFAALAKAIEIRNRVVHPKVASDLDISSEDLEVIGRAFNWYTAFALRMSSATVDSLQTHMDRLKKAFDATKDV